MANILIIDDDEQYPYMLASMLKQHNYNVTVAHDGKDALVFLREKSFDLIITDIFMPDMDGFEFLNWIKAKNLNHSRVIAISGGNHSTDSKLMLDSMLAAFKEYVKAALLKPFAEEQLLQEVDAILSGAK